MTSENPKQYYPEGNACWLSTDILVEHFPHLEREIFLLDDSDIAYLDKKASGLSEYSYWIAMKIVITEYIGDKKKDEFEEEEGFEGGME